LGESLEFVRVARKAKDSGIIIGSKPRQRKNLRKTKTFFCVIVVEYKYALLLSRPSTDRLSSCSNNMMKAILVLDVQVTTE
jgi:hypothetical protein